MAKRMMGYAVGVALAALMLVPLNEAWAACATTISGKDGTGATITTCAGTDGSTGLFPNVQVQGGANGANRMDVDSNSAAAVNVKDVAGSAISQGHGTAATAIRVELPTDGTGLVTTNPATPANIGVAATAAAVPANAVYGAVNYGGNLTGVIGDACTTSARTFTPINISTATTTRLVAPTSAKKTYICGLFIISAGTQNVGIVEGTGGTCGTGTAGVIGGTTAATGPNLTAQVGFVMPATNYAQAATAGTNVDFCLITSAAVQISGVLVSAQGP